MGLWLFMTSLLLTLSMTTLLPRMRRARNNSATYRSSVLASIAMTTLIWGTPYFGSRISPGSGLLAAAGAFVGGVLTTTLTTGFVEDNFPPPVGVREKLLAFHSPTSGLVYPREPRMKRVLDLALASVGLAVTLPLWILIACMIWLEEPGPILFTKNSVGRGGITFRQFKFRSMKHEAERLTGPVAASASDPRTLRCGKLLRRWHLDELPELINVLTGTMSLVGPRPLRAVLVQQYLEDLPEFAERHTVRPGIACIAQIQKYHISPAERLRKDRAYIRRASVGLDVKLLWHAVVTTVRGQRNDG